MLATTSHADSFVSECPSGGWVGGRDNNSHGMAQSSSPAHMASQEHCLVRISWK